MIIICTRDPDSSNEYATFLSPGEDEPTIHTLDYGRSDLSDPVEFAEWRNSHEQDAFALIRLRTTEGIRAGTHILDALAEAAENYGHTDLGQTVC